MVFMEATKISLRPIELKTVYPERGATRDRARWVAVFMRPGFVVHEPLPLLVLVDSRDEAMAYAAANAVPFGYALV